jgi:ubiquinone biosynthesis protein UbiJ
MFLRALMQYIQELSPMLSLDLQHKAMSLKYALRQQDKEMEKRITENVLKSISVRLENNGVIAEIESLREAIERLGK